MKYRYRWYYVAVMIIALCGFSYWYDFEEAWTALGDLKIAEAHLQEKLIHLQQYVQQSPPLTLMHDKQSDLMTAIVNTAQFCGLTVQSMTLMMPKLIRIVAEGEYAQLVQFADKLSQQKKPLLIRNFTYQKNQSQKLLMTLELAVYDGMVNLAPLLNHDHALTAIADPFCGSQAITFITPPDLSRYAIGQIKMLGCLQQASRKTAMIALPDHTMADVEVGAEIGVEKAIVVQIKDHEMILRLPNGTETHMRMSEENHDVA